MHATDLHVVADTDVQLAFGRRRYRGLAGGRRSSGEERVLHVAPDRLHIPERKPGPGDVGRPVPDVGDRVDLREASRVWPGTSIKLPLSRA